MGISPRGARQRNCVLVLMCVTQALGAYVRGAAAHAAPMAPPHTSSPFPKGTRPGGTTARFGRQAKERATAPEDLSSCTSRREQEHRLSNLHRGLAQCGTASPHQRQKVQSLAAKDPPPPPLAGKTNGGSGSLPAPPRSGTSDDLPDRASILGMVPSARGGP